jgi:integrase
MAKRRGDGEGSIYFDKKRNLWVAELMIGWKEVIDRKTGKLRQKKNILKLYGKERNEVRDKLAEVVSSRAQGTFVEPQKVTVAEWLDTWLNDYKKMSLRLITWEGYATIIKVHIKPEIGSLPLKSLRPEHLQRLYNAKFESGLSPRMVRYIHTVIHGALKQAVKNGLVPRNVSEATSLPKQKKKEARVLSVEEQEKLVKAFEGERLGIAFYTLLGTGLRRGELLGLRWQDVNLKDGVIHVRQTLVPVSGGFIFQEPKTKQSKRDVPLPTKLQKALKVHQKQQEWEKRIAGDAYQDHGLVFCREDGQPIKPRDFNAAFEVVTEKAGVNINLHGLRHTFATRCLEQGIDAKTVSELLGHSTITITLDTYTHVMPERKRDAAAKLNEVL